MSISAAEQIENEIDDLLATALHAEIGNSIQIRASGTQLAALHTNYTPSWRILSGPLTSSIIVVLNLGPYFHLAWDVTEPEEAAIARLLEGGQPLHVVVSAGAQPRLRIEVPPLPDELRPNLLTAYIPVSAA